MYTYYKIIRKMPELRILMIMHDDFLCLNKNNHISSTSAYVTCHIRRKGKITQWQSERFFPISLYMCAPPKMPNSPYFLGPFPILGLSSPLELTAVPWLLTARWVFLCCSGLSPESGRAHVEAPPERCIFSCILQEWKSPGQLGFSWSVLSISIKAFKTFFSLFRLFPLILY